MCCNIPITFAAIGYCVQFFCREMQCKISLKKTWHSEQGLTPGIVKPKGVAFPIDVLGIKLDE
jgi:hypothetical protein